MRSRIVEFEGGQRPPPQAPRIREPMTSGWGIGGASGPFRLHYWGSSSSSAPISRSMRRRSLFCSVCVVAR